MPTRRFFSLMLLSATSATAASSGFVLGVDYSEWLAPNATKIATDSSGAIYVLSSFGISANTPPSTVTKLSGDGRTIVWQNQLGFPVSTMAVGPQGSVYVTPISLAGGTFSISVAKLGDAGKGVAWTSPAQGPVEFGSNPALAADSVGRAYLAVFLQSGQGLVVRLNAAGGVDYSKAVAGWPTSVAVDGAGAAFVAGYGLGAGLFLARLAPDGSAGFYSSTNPPRQLAPTVALDASGNAVVYEAGVLQRFDSTGAVTFSKTVATWELSYPGLALDAAGNAYILGSSSATVYPVRNTLATCGSDLLSVFAPDGTPLQTTYIPGGVFHAVPSVAMGHNSTVLLVATAAASFAPTQTGPFPANGGSGADFLLRLSPIANAVTFPLACVGNAASYTTGPIAPGGIFTLFGSGLGPAVGIQTQATPGSPFPTQAAGVQVTFDGTPAPLLWVQDAQINLVAPWSLTPGQATQVCASYNGGKTNCLTWPVAQTSPGVFAALNQDGTVNSATNPAAPGSIVSLFATGLGPIMPPQADGTLVGFPLPTNALPVEVDYLSGPGPPFGNGPPVPLELTYVGPAPYLVAGASQINVRIVPNARGIVVKASGQSQGFVIYSAGQ